MKIENQQQIQIIELHAVASAPPDCPILRKFGQNQPAYFTDIEFIVSQDNPVKSSCSGKPGDLEICKNCILYNNPSS